MEQELVKGSGDRWEIHPHSLKVAGGGRPKWRVQGLGKAACTRARSTVTDHAQQHCFLLRGLFCFGANGSFIDCASVAAHSHSVLQRDRERPCKRTQCGMIG